MFANRLRNRKDHDLDTHAFTVQVLRGPGSGVLGRGQVPAGR